MTYDVLLTDQAEQDVDDIHRYIAQRDGTARATNVINALQKACDGLANFPERGDVPRELEGLGISEYRQVHYKPYRVIYRILGQRVIVYAVLDGRRDMQTLLQRRLTR